MSRFTTPGSEIESFVITLNDGKRHTLTVKGDVTVSASQTKREKQDDAHTPIPKFILKHKVGTMKFAVVTDQALGFVDRIEDARATITLLSGRILRVIGMTFSSEDGVEENTTQGETNELEFSFVTIDDRDS